MIEIRSRTAAFLLWATAVFCIVLLFAGDGKFGVRSLDRLWDLGHLPAFGLFAYLLVTRWKNLARRPFPQRLLMALAVIAASGLAIEMLQLLVGRTFSWLDLRKDLLGAATAIVFWTPARQHLAQRTSLGFKLLLIGWVLWEAASAGRALVDEALAWRQFPLLSGLETPFERDRWSGNAGFFIDRRIHSQGETALRVELGTDVYSGVGMDYFPRDWRHHGFLCIDLFNPEPEPIALTCRVNDTAHNRSGNRYEDRFNRIFHLTAGWQTIAIPLEEIRTAPQERAMQMDAIDNFMLFAIRLPRPRIIYIDNVRLEP